MDGTRATELISGQVQETLQMRYLLLEISAGDCASGGGGGGADCSDGGGAEREGARVTKRLPLLPLLPTTTTVSPLLNENGATTSSSNRSLRWVYKRGYCSSRLNGYWVLLGLNGVILFST